MTEIWLEQAQDDEFDPLYDLIEEFEKRCQDLADNPRDKQQVLTVSKDTTAELHKITLEWSSQDSAQLLLLQIKGLEFSLSAYLGEIEEVQASFTWGYLSSQLPEVFFSDFTTPFDLKIMDHDSAPPRPIFDFGGAGSLDRQNMKVFTELGGGHWAHLIGLRHRAALDMTKFFALDLVLNSWMGFVQAIRENALLQKKFF